jgi:hypothetical protein
MEDVFAEARRFIDPVLAGDAGVWDLASRSWRRE